VHGEALQVVDLEVVDRDWRWPDGWEAVGRGTLGMAREVPVVDGGLLS
jgi:hypothetical protein